MKYRPGDSRIPIHPHSWVAPNTVVIVAASADAVRHACNLALQEA